MSKEEKESYNSNTRIFNFQWGKQYSQMKKYFSNKTGVK